MSEFTISHNDNSIGKFVWDDDALYAIDTSWSSYSSRIQQIVPEPALLDVRPGGEMDGVEAAEEIRARLGIPVIYLSALPDVREPPLALPARACESNEDAIIGAELWLYR